MNPLSILISLLFYAYAIYEHNWPLLILFIAMDVIFYIICEMIS